MCPAEARRVGSGHVGKGRLDMVGRGRARAGERLPGRRLIAGVTLTRERQASGDRSNGGYSLFINKA